MSILCFWPSIQRVNVTNVLIWLKNNAVSDIIFNISCQNLSFKSFKILKLFFFPLGQKIIAFVDNKWVEYTTREKNTQENHPLFMIKDCNRFYLYLIVSLHAVNLCAPSKWKFIQLERPQFPYKIHRAQARKKSRKSHKQSGSIIIQQLFSIHRNML